MPTKIEISYKTIFFTIFFLILLWFLVQIREIIFWVFIAFILMSAFKPLVDFLENMKLPRFFAILIIYVVLISSISYISISIVPPLIKESIHLGERLPDYLKALFPFYSINSQLINQQIAPLGENLLKVSVGLFNNIISVFTIFVITFYLLLERKHLEVYLSDLVGDESSKHIIIIIRKVEDRLGYWLRGQAGLMLTIGLFSYLGLLILGIPYALPLAIFAGFLELIPTIGPVVSAIPAILIALSTSPLLAILTLVLYFLIQQLENHLIVPQVMRKVVGLPPLVTIIALLIGANLAGIGGIILAVPIVVTTQAIVTEYFRIKDSGLKTA